MPNRNRPIHSRRPRQSRAASSPFVLAVPGYGEFDPYYRWLAIPPEGATRRLLPPARSLRSESDVDIIEYAADRQMDFIRRQQSGNGAQPLSQQLLNEVVHAARSAATPKVKSSTTHNCGLNSKRCNRRWPHPPQVRLRRRKVLMEVRFGNTACWTTLPKLVMATSSRPPTGRSGRLVAITILSDAATRDPQLGLRFRLKAQALSRAQHPGLLKAYDAGH